MATTISPLAAPRTQAATTGPPSAMAILAWLPAGSRVTGASQPAARAARLVTTTGAVAPPAETPSPAGPMATTSPCGFTASAGWMPSTWGSSNDQPPAAGASRS